jgi:hypothetical protein
MTNPSTIDRRDVSHATNPIGGQGHVEETDKANASRPLDPGAAKLPLGGNDAALSGMPEEARDPSDSGMAEGVPPARGGQSANPAVPPAPEDTNPGRLDQVRAEGRKTAQVQSPLPNR